MLRIRNVSKCLGQFSVKDVSLDVREGEYFMVIGPSGAGKTILLETVAGIHEPDAGEIVLDDRNITCLAPKDRGIGIVYQDYMLFPHLTVEKNIQFGLRSANVSPPERAKKVREYAGLLNISGLLDRYPGTLSGGERQRTAIARALAIQPKVLLLDEPLNALDAEMRNMLQEELKRIHTMTGTTIVHITHSFDEVFSLGDRVAVMDSGSIIQVGRPDDVFGRPASEFVARFTGTENIFRGESTADGDRSRVIVDGVTITSATVRQGPVSVCIRPENIRVLSAVPDRSVPNLLEGIVEKVASGGTFVRLAIDAGVPFVVMMMRKEFESLRLEKNATVFVTFDPSSVHLF